ncbi:MAG: ABC transporter substrate-binding protein, partial [Thiotrichales bacterium]|nr:ABC transporter substrate-binding protein [Thiotrichales bacterium]
MKSYVTGSRAKTVASLLLGGAVGIGFCAQSVTAADVQKGGTLDFVVAGEAPSKDGHKETTYAIVHPFAPFYSLLIRVDPENPQSSDFVCDLCVGGVPEPTNGGKTYTFKIKEGVTFHDGTPMTAQDIKATYDKIIFPPEGVASARKAFFNMVESVEAPDDTTFVVNLAFPSG